MCAAQGVAELAAGLQSHDEQTALDTAYSLGALGGLVGEHLYSCCMRVSLQLHQGLSIGIAAVRRARRPICWAPAAPARAGSFEMAAGLKQ